MMYWDFYHDALQKPKIVLTVHNFSQARLAALCAEGEEFK